MNFEYDIFLSFSSKDERNLLYLLPFYILKRFVRYLPASCQ